MCETCGCGEATSERSDHAHDDHPHSHAKPRRIEIEQSVKEKNDAIARRNREWFETNRVGAFNLISSPGAGKTTLLERTLEKLGSKMRISVITGDPQTDHDAERLRRYSDSVHQINTISGCHLDAAMVHRELGTFVDPSVDLLIIENVGNLVCPAAFDLGEHKTIALLSTTEGEDKPVKYPVLFNKADAVVITKTDLIPHLDWDADRCNSYVRQVNSKAVLLQVSAKTGEGIEGWLRYLQSEG